MADPPPDGATGGLTIASPMLAAPTDPRLRVRVLVVGGLVLAMVASAVLLEHGKGGPSAQASGGPGTSRAASGAWFCPHGGSEGWQGWVILANPGTAPVRARLTSLSPAGSKVLETLAVPPMSETVREVPAQVAGASTEVEYFGGWLAAEAVVDSGPGIAAARCAAAPHQTWFALDGSTAPGHAAHLVVMNPFAEVAEFEVVLRTNERTVRPGDLTPHVVPARRSVDITLNDYVLLGPGETALAAEVTAKLGRVITGDVVVTDGGLRADTALPAPATTWVIPATGWSGTPSLVLFDPGTLRADLSVISQGPSGQIALSGTGGQSVDAEAVRAISLRAGTDGGWTVTSTNGRPVLAVVVAGGPGADSVAIAGSSRPQHAWLVLPAGPPGARAVVVLQNPGRTEARVSFRLLGPQGPLAATRVPAVTVAAGRTIQVVLPLIARTTPAVVATAVGGTIVAASASLGAAGYAVTLGLPIKG